LAGITLLAIIGLSVLYFLPKTEEGKDGAKTETVVQENKDKPAEQAKDSEKIDVPVEEDTWDRVWCYFNKNQYHYCSGYLFIIAYDFLLLVFMMNLNN